MFDVLRLIVRVRVVPRIVTASLIAVASAATWPHPPLHPLHQALVLWPIVALTLYASSLLIHPRWSFVLAGILLSVALAGVALMAGLPGSAILSGLAPIHAAWFAASLVQAAVWWSEGEDWQQLAGGATV